MADRGEHTTENSHVKHSTRQTTARVNCGVTMTNYVTKMISKIPLLSSPFGRAEPALSVT